MGKLAQQFYLRKRKGMINKRRVNGLEVNDSLCSKCRLHGFRCGNLTQIKFTVKKMKCYTSWTKLHTFLMLSVNDLQVEFA